MSWWRLSKNNNIELHKPKLVRKEVEEIIYLIVRKKIHYQN